MLEEAGCLEDEGGSGGEVGEHPADRLWVGEGWWEAGRGEGSLGATEGAQGTVCSVSHGWTKEEAAGAGWGLHGDAQQDDQGAGAWVEDQERVTAGVLDGGGVVLGCAGAVGAGAVIAWEGPDGGT